MKTGNVIVTGGAGFIGSHLSRRLLSLGCRVICVDNFEPYYPKVFKDYNLQDLIENKDFVLVKGDILDIDEMSKLIRNEKPETIFHMAALAGVRPSIKTPERYEKTNITGTRQLATIAAENGVKHFIFASSSSVYGVNEHTPFSEKDSLLKPVSPYAVSKLAAEGMLHTVHHLTGINATSLRFFTVYGPCQRPEMAIHKFTRLIDQGLEIPFYGDGSSARDYSWIHDIIDGVIASAEKPEGYRIYNLGGSKTVTLSNLIEHIETALGKKAILDKLPDQQGDVPVTCADTRHSFEDLGYNAAVEIKEGVRLFVDWYKMEGRKLHELANQ